MKKAAIAAPSKVDGEDEKAGAAPAEGEEEATPAGLGRGQR